MTETARTVPPKNIPLPPLKVFQNTYCKHCIEHCNPNETRFLACVLTAVLDLEAYRTKLRIERPRW